MSIYLCRNNLFLFNATFANQAIFFMVVVKNSHVKLLAHFYTSRKPGDELLIDRGGVWELVVERNHLFNRLTTDSFHARSKA